MDNIEFPRISEKEMKDLLGEYHKKMLKTFCGIVMEVRFQDQMILTLI